MMKIPLHPFAHLNEESLPNEWLSECNIEKRCPNGYTVVDEKEFNFGCDKTVSYDMFEESVDPFETAGYYELFNTKSSENTNIENTENTESNDVNYYHTYPCHLRGEERAKYFAKFPPPT